ncbi:MAG: hypothetical protein WBR13_03110 [Allosphingosinicella sp.]
MSTGTRPFDAAEYLESADHQAGLLDDAVEEMACGERAGTDSLRLRVFV